MVLHIKLAMRRNFETWNTCGLLCNVNAHDAHWKLRRQNMQHGITHCAGLMTRTREIRWERITLFSFSPRVFYHNTHVLSQHGCSANRQFIRVQITTTLHVLSSQLSVSVTRIHLTQKAARVSSFILPRIAHRECHHRRQSWVPCVFESRPFVREKHAWNLFLSDEWPTGTLETLDFTINIGGTPVRIYLR